MAMCNVFSPVEWVSGENGSAVAQLNRFTIIFVRHINVIDQFRIEFEQTLRQIGMQRRRIQQTQMEDRFTDGAAFFDVPTDFAVRRWIQKVFALTHVGQMLIDVEFVVGIFQRTNFGQLLVPGTLSVTHQHYTSDGNVFASAPIVQKRFDLRDRAKAM